ncbi:hypothetical protein Bbelb_263520 [Branchiostoma belcheri]|nr:hypothetical protein Bbelb_263520 [Branchiostoma belcheri]
MDKTQRLKERTGYAQIVLIAFVVFLLLPGAALVIAGAWMIFHMSWTEILTPGRSAKTESVLTCVGGALTVILAAIIVHAHRDLRWFRQGVTMREIGIFLVVIVMLEFAVATTCTVRENIPTGQLGIELNRTLQAVKRNVSRAPAAEWARLQTSTDCCGIWNFTDWTNRKADNGSNINGSSSFPESCKCRATSGNDCHRTSDGNAFGSTRKVKSVCTWQTHLTTNKATNAQKSKLSSEIQAEASDVWYQPDRASDRPKAGGRSDPREGWDRG